MPATASTTNIERQPNAVWSVPPIIGASTGATAITEEMIDSSRPARAPEYMSRTMARVTTTAPEPPSACATRARISISIDVASMQTIVAAQNSATAASRTGLRPSRSDTGP